jgi:hypothetical protein
VRSPESFARHTPKREHEQGWGLHSAANIQECAGKLRRQQAGNLAPSPNRAFGANSLSSASKFPILKLFPDSVFVIPSSFVLRHLVTKDEHDHEHEHEASAGDEWF